MKKSIFAVAIFAIALVFSNNLTAQKFSGLDKSPLDVTAFPKSHKEANKVVKVTYSRPQLKGRSVESLAKPGEVWRTGANEAAEIRFYEDVKFGGKSVKAGTYTLFTIPGEKEWTVILNKASNVWGGYSYNASEDVVRVKGEVSKSKENIEAFSMVFDGKMTLCLGWGHTIVKVPVSK
ncbi:DUF2911 domain-containing protein [Flavicella sediminum]|uniref:DUF2911 domain-containing protein n=1 Tax=Flavicella sediminum TaxID=2585141 RepID=UPI00111EF197|nr:DUF2911 domain-containing protein [Flavicella sediminum]